MRVFSIKNLTRIPSQYILKRWTKEAKKGTMDYEQDNHSSGNAKEAEIVWRNSMLRIANTIISKSQEDDSLKSICQKILLGLDEKLKESQQSWVQMQFWKKMKSWSIIQLMKCLAYQTMC